MQHHRIIIIVITQYNTCNTWILDINFSFRWNKLVQKVEDTAQHVMLNAIGSPLIERYPQFVPVLGSVSLDLLKQNIPAQLDEELPYAIHYRYGISLAPVYDMEFAFPINLDDDENGFQLLIEAVQFVVKEAQKEAEGNLLLCQRYVNILYIGKI